jgi:hypothetical protein
MHLCLSGPFTKYVNILQDFSAMLFNVPILIGLFSCQGIAWCKKLTLSHNRVFHEFFHSNAHWTLLAAVVLHFGGILHLIQLFITFLFFLFLFFFWGGGGRGGVWKC